MPSMVCNQCISVAWILCWSSAVNVHVSQAYRKMNFTIVCTDFSFDLILILLSCHTNLRHNITAAVCAVLARIYGFEPASQGMAPRYLKWLTDSDSSSDPPTVSLFWKPFLLLVITFVFLAFIAMPSYLETEPILCTKLASLASLLATMSISSAYLIFDMFLQPMLTVLEALSSASPIICSRKNIE